MKEEKLTTTGPLFPFFAELCVRFLLCRYNNYGDLGIEIKNLVDDFPEASKMNHNIQSIEDMQVGFATPLPPPPSTLSAPLCLFFSARTSVDQE